MATLDDKLLGEKLHYYCSSSSSEDENESEDEGKETPISSQPKDSPPPTHVLGPANRDAFSVNTGPKGVIKDFEEFKRLEREKMEAKERAKLEMIKKLSLTCKSHLDEEKDKRNEDVEDLDTLLKEDTDNIFEEYLKKRMQTMYHELNRRPKYGHLFELKDGDEFLQTIESEEDKLVTIIVHIYSPDVSGCEAMNGCLECLAQDYPQVKFCKLSASAAQMSRRFEIQGVPALLAYKGGNLIASFVRMTHTFGEDFFADEVENFLLEHGLLPDKSLVPTIIRAASEPDDAEGSELDED